MTARLSVFSAVAYVVGSSAEARGKLVLPPVFKTGVGRESGPSGFDPRALPPSAHQENKLKYVKNTSSATVRTSICVGGLVLVTSSFLACKRNAPNEASTATRDAVAGPAGTFGRCRGDDRVKMPMFYEGGRCCADGYWRANEGNGSSTCPDDVPLRK